MNALIPIFQEQIENVPANDLGALAITVAKIAEKRKGKVSDAEIIELVPTISNKAGGKLSPDKIHKKLGIAEVLNFPVSVAPPLLTSTGTIVDDVPKYDPPLPANEAQHLPKLKLAEADRFAFIESLVRVYDRRTDNLLTIAEFKALTSNYPRVKSGESTRPWADVWLSDANRPQYMAMVFDPGYTGKEHLNRWEGWPYEPIAGSVEPFLALLRHVVGENHEKTVLQWFAYPLQNPGKRSLFALVLVSHAHGLGKGLLVKTVGKLHGKGFKTPSARQVTGDFNGWLATSTFAVFEEFSIEGNRGLMARIKELITEPQMMINEKNQPAYMSNNLTSGAFLTNDHAGLYFEPTDRRGYVIDCTNSPAPASVYEEFVRWRDNDGYNHLMRFLLHVDLSNYRATGHAPATADKDAMADLTATDLERWLKDFSENAPKAIYTRLEIKHKFEDYSGTRSTESAVGRALKRLGLGAECRIQIAGRKDRPRVVAIREPGEWQKRGAAAWADEYTSKAL